jgi:hypothetical protein
MSNRHQRRADLADFKRKASHTALLTYLCPPDDPALDRAPLLRAAARDWLGRLATRVRYCIVCNSWLVNRQDVGALLLSVFDIAKPTDVGIAAVCKACWDADDIEALERAVEQTLRSVIPNGKLEPLDAPR